MAININSIIFPKQTIADSKKTKKFYKDCVDSAVKLVGTENYNGVRFSREERFILYSLGTDDVDPRDMEKTFNPLGLPDLKDSFKNIRNYPFEQSIFTLLKGESQQRPFNYTVKLLNPEAVSEINEKKKGLLMQFAQNKVMSEGYDEEKAKEELDSLIDEIYNYRDIRSINANKILDKLRRDNRLEEQFDRTWDSNQYVGEEIMFFDIVNGELKVSHVNDLNLFLIGAGTSNRIEDADCIIYQDYLNSSQIISYYRDYLKENDINKLQGEGPTEQNEIYPEYFPAAPTVDGEGYVIDEATFDEGVGSYRNGSNDIRVLRIFWKGKRQIQVVKTIDEAGNVARELYDEKYEVNEDLGEILEDTIYIDRWEQGTLIEDNIYVQMQPWAGNTYSKVDYSLRAHPFVGYINTLNNVAPISLMKKIKNHKYLYNVLRHEYETSIGKDFGNVAEIDLANMPNKEGWSTDRVMYYMKAVGIKFVDSTNQTEEGKYVGNNTTGRTLNLSQFDKTAQLNQLLEQIKAEAYEISGVTPQRLGQTSSRETKGGIERSVLQSSNTTEPWYKAHDSFKERVYTNILELSKIWIQNEKVQVGDWANDMLTMVDEIDGEDFSYWDYGIYVSSSAKDMALRGSIDEMAGMLLQSEVIKFSEFLAIKANDDVNLSMNIIKRGEKKKEESAMRQAQEAQKQQQAQQEFLAQQEELKFQRELQIKSLENQNLELLQRLKNENALELEELKMEGSETTNKLAENKIELDRLKAEQENTNKKIELAIKEKEANARIKQVNSNNNK